MSRGDGGLDGDSKVNHDPLETVDDPQLGAVLATLLELYESGLTPDRSEWLAD